MNCFNHKKAQTLTELATFGSVLLLVLSFFVSYGIRYNFQQDTQMRSFRIAMQEAYNNSRPDASGSLVLVEDKHIPDPRDTFGVGNIVPAQASAEVVWGNVLEDKYEDGTDLPRMKFIINGEPVKNKVNGKEYDDYTTAGYSFIFKTVPADKDGFYAEIPGEGRVQIKWEDARIYKPDPADKNPPTQIKVAVKIGPKDEGDTEMISAVSDSETGSMKQIVKIYPEDGKDGELVTRLDLLDPSVGEINPRYFNIGQDTGNVDATGSPIYVTPATLQGLLPEDTTQIRRNDTLRLKENSASYMSNTVSDVTTTITRRIRDNSGNKVDIGADSPHKLGTINLPWQTPK